MKSKNIYHDKVFSMLPGDPVLYHPALKKALGSINASIWFCQLLYWYDKGSKTNEIYKSRNDFKNEIGLSRDQQIRVENHLKEIGVIKITVKPGRPSLINHICIDFIKLKEVIYNVLETRTLEKRQTNTQTHSSTSVFTTHRRTRITDNIPEITQKNIQKDINETNNEGSGRSDFLANRKKLGI